MIVKVIESDIRQATIKSGKLKFAITAPKDGIIIIANGNVVTTS